MSAGIIGGNLAVLREMQSRFGATKGVALPCGRCPLDPKFVTDSLLPLMDFRNQMGNNFVVGGSVIQIMSLIGIIAKVIELVFILVAKAKFLSIGRNNGAS